jgi:hypothetical protein
MDTKKFINALRSVIAEEVRNVIRQELTEILKEGLQPTINELQEQTKPAVSIANKKPKSEKLKFKSTRFSDILNETDPVYDNTPSSLHETITMTSRDAVNFGQARKMMHSAITGTSTPVAPSTVLDPEGNKELVVDETVAKAMTRDYSALMRAIDKKKGR